MKRSAALLFPLLAACSPGASFDLQTAWGTIDDPQRFSRTEQTVWRNLPRKGSLERVPWGGWSWKTHTGGIAYRWQTQETVWDYTSPSSPVLRNLDEEVLSKLSPAEKYDLFTGDRDFPTVAAEKKRSWPGAPRWFGICHGWAAAALLLEEPHPVIMASPEGLSIPFGSADVKAILSYFLGDVLKGRIEMAGKKCDGTSGCEDFNPGSFHLILANRIGRLRKGVIFDSEPGVVVWNRPAHAFETKVLEERQTASPGAAPGTRQEVTVETRVAYGVRTPPRWNAENARESEWETYRYRLELDSQGRIIGGQWLSQRHPDYAWMRGENALENAPAPLVRLYRASVGMREPDETGRQCPKDSQSVRGSPEHDATYCISGNDVIAPLTWEMRLRCSAHENSDACSEKTWPLMRFQRYRGNEECPPGTSLDYMIDACSDGNFVYGPFRIEQVDACVASGRGGLCTELVWPQWEAELFLTR